MQHMRYIPEAGNDFTIIRTPQTFNQEQCHLIFLYMQYDEDNWKTIIDLYPPQRSPRQLFSEGFALLFTERFLPEHPEMLNQLQYASLNLQHTSICLPETMAGTLCNTFQKIEEEFFSQNHDRLEMIRAYMHRVLSCIQKARGNNMSNNRLVNKFLQLLADSSFTPAQGDDSGRFVSYYASRLFVHPNHLSVTVKKETGKSANDLIALKIIQLAKVKLLKTDLSIKEIAFQLSFKEAAHFSNFFKRYTCLSPVQYREHHKALH